MKHFWRFLPPALTLFIAQIQPATANTGSLWFEEVSEEARILNGGASWGSSWGDFNGDGWPDLWTSSHHRAPSLYLNMKDGTFEDIASQVLSVDIWEQIELRDAHGAAWADFDNDGDQDLIEFADGGSSRQQPNYILVNNGGAYFEEQSEELGISVLQARGRTPLWLDWDKDGRLDILITSLSTPFVSLYQQNDFGFEDITNSIGLNIDKLTQFAFLSDFTSDGALDLALSPTDLSIRVFSKENNTLVEQTTSLGLDQYFSSIDSISSDLNGDLVPDAYVVRGEVTSDVVLVSDTKIEAHLTARKNEVGFVFLTNGTISVDLYPTFAVDPSKVYIGSSGLNPSSSSFTLSSQDPGTEGIATHEPGVSDGVYIGFDTINQSWSLISSTSGRVASNFVIESDKPISGISALGFDPSLPAPDDSLLIKTGGVYLDNTLLAGINAPSSGRNIAVGDFDNDMDLDIYIVSTGPVENLPNILYENNGAGIFTPVQGAGGAAGTLLGRGDAVSVADYNQDGFLDLFVTNGISKAPFHFDGPYQLFRNIGNGNHWIEIDLEGVTSNRDGIGARVLLTAGGVTQLREQGGGMHLRAQNHQRLHFGLGAATAIDKIEIEWPSGIRQTLSTMPIDQVVRIVEQDADNGVPIIGGTPATTVAQGEAYSFIPTSSDPDGNTLLFSITNLPAWANFDTATGAVSGTPTNADVGATAGIVITVDDQQGQPNSVASLASFNLEVSNVNDAPALDAAIGTQSATQNAPFGPLNVSSNFSDPDEDTLTFSINGLAAGTGLSISTTGIISGTPTQADATSINNVTVTATDPSLATASDTFTLTVFPDSNGDGLSDERAIALGLDSNDPEGDTDNDGISDVVEVGDPNAPLDTDGDGRLDALEPGSSASDASVVSSLPLTNGGMVTLSTAAGEMLSQVVMAEATGGPTGVTFPFGMMSYTTTSEPGGSVTVRMTFSADLPANLVIYKIDNAGIFTELPTNIWARVDARTVDITLTDGDPLTDLDGETNGSINDPIAVADAGNTVAPVAASGGGGGGCALNTAAEKDPIFPLLLLMSLVHLFRRCLRSLLSQR